jgi:hypothetical protein
MSPYLVHLIVVNADAWGSVSAILLLHLNEKSNPLLIAGLIRLALQR